MAVPLLDLKRENRPLLDQIKRKLEPILQSSQFVMGEQVSSLEEKLLQYLKMEKGKALGVSSGTDALLLALMAMDLEANSEVITSPFTFFATVGAIHRAGYRPVFADIQEDTFNIDPEQVLAQKSNKTKALLPVHLFGQAADMDKLMNIAKENSLLVLEDAAQSIGGKYQDKHLGSIGDFGAFSFFPTKNLGAFGDGGLLTINNINFSDKATRMRVHGMQERYHHIDVGGNFRLDTIQAAILLVKIAYLDSWHEMRRKNASLYNRLFDERNLQEHVVLPVEKEGNFHIYNQYVIRVKNEKRDALKNYLDSKKIGTAIYYPTPMHLLESFQYLGYKKGDFPVAEKACQEVLALPVHSYITVEEIMEVVETVTQFFS